MTSLITLPIRLPLEITVRAAKLGVGLLRAATELIQRDEADRAHAAEGGGSGVPRPVEEDRRPAATERPQAPEPPAPVAALIDVDAPNAEELEPIHVDSEPQLAYEAGPADDVGATVHVDAPW